MVSAQPGAVPQVNGDLTHAIFWVATILVDLYFDYCCACLMRGNSDEETLRSKEAYKRLLVTHVPRMCA